MTNRERFLLLLLGLTALGTLALWGGQTYLDQLGQADQRFASLQKEAAQVQMRLVQNAAQPTDPGANLAAKFWDAGALPDPVALAQKVKPVLDRWGVQIQEFQVVVANAQELGLRYVLVTPIAPFLQAALELRSADEKLLVRKFTARFKEAGVYTVEWEVGYAVLP